MKINNKSVCYLVLEGANPCYPKYKTIFHLKEMEMGSQQIDGLKDLKRKPKISGTFTVDRIEVKTKECPFRSLPWWQFWRIL